MTQRGLIEAVKILIKAGIDPNKITSYGKSPFLEAITGSDNVLVKMFIENGVDPSLPISETSGRMVYGTKQKPLTSMYPLHYALIQAWDGVVVRTLLHHGVDPNAHLMEGKPAILHASVLNKTRKISRVLLKVLIDHGANTAMLKSELQKKIDQIAEDYKKAFPNSSFRKYRSTGKYQDELNFIAQLEADRSKVRRGIDPEVSRAFLKKILKLNRLASYCEDTPINLDRVDAEIKRLKKLFGIPENKGETSKDLKTIIGSRIKAFIPFALIEYAADQITEEKKLYVDSIRFYMAHNLIRGYRQMRGTAPLSYDERRQKKNIDVQVKVLSRNAKSLNQSVLYQPSIKELMGWYRLGGEIGVAMLVELAGSNSPIRAIVNKTSLPRNSVTKILEQTSKDPEMFQMYFDTDTKIARIKKCHKNRWKYSTAQKSK